MIKRTNSAEFDERGIEISIKQPQNNQSNPLGQLVADSAVLRNQQNPHHVIPIRESKIIKRYVRDNHSQENLQNEENREQAFHIPVSQREVIADPNPPQVSAGNKHKFMSATNLAGRNNNGNKIPDSIKQTIVKLASGRKPVGSMTTSKLTRFVLEKYRQFRYAFICDICSMEYDAKDRIKFGTCEHSFCDSCLRHYVDYKISRFQQVLCPAQSCPEIIDQQSEFYKSLNQNLKNKYKKVHAFAVVAKNPNTRLCPNQKCKQGILVIEEGVSPQCNVCGKVYCGKCLYPQHQGSCDKSELDFFQKNLHFQQCSKCKNVVQKSVGCNHIKCRCGYQFCYNCGEKWLNYQHRCPVKSAQTIAAPQTQQNINVVQPVPYVRPNNTCQCLQGDDNLITMGRVVVKALVFFPLVILLVSLILAGTLALIGIVLVMTIVMGMFPYACQFICSRECPFPVIFIILYPISMICGIGIAFYDFFIEVVPRIVGGACECVESIWDRLLGW